MRIGFWNLNNKDDILPTVVAYAHGESIDMLILLECSLSTPDVLHALNQVNAVYYFYQPITSDFVQIYMTFSTSFFVEVQDAHRITAKQYNSPFGKKINFIILHFVSKLYFNDTEQDAHSVEVKHFIDEVEAKTACDSTIVIGDFNMNPFQNGMIQTTGLHSTFDRRTALSVYRTVQNNTYKWFYNPMWSFFGELGKGDVNGTHYYSKASPICYFWNIFDQVLLRPSLLTNIFDEDSLTIVKNVGVQSLLNANRTTDRKFSDHLPIQFNLTNI